MTLNIISPKPLAPPPINLLQLLILLPLLPLRPAPLLLTLLKLLLLRRLVLLVARFAFAFARVFLRLGVFPGFAVFVVHGDDEEEDEAVG